MMRRFVFSNFIYTFVLYI